MDEMDRLNQSLNRVLSAFSKELTKIEKLTGVKRESIALSLYRLNMNRGRKWEANLWKATESKRQLLRWIKETREEAEYSEDAFLELAELLPKWARRSLSEMARMLPAPHGGKRRALRFRDRMLVVQRVKELTESAATEKKLSKTKAYEKVATEMKVSSHTIRIICDPKERERSKAPKRETDSLPQDQLDTNED
jgi:hypothetical protein